MNTAELLAAAKEGDLDRLLELVERDKTDDGDGEGLLAYRWLLVAEDFGHEVDHMLDAILAAGPLVQDDSIESVIHFYLGVDYLRGAEGLPVDHALARKHLEKAHDLEVHCNTNLPDTFADLRSKLDREARAVFSAVFGRGRAKRRGDAP